MSLESVIQGIIDKLTRRQADALKLKISTVFVAGFRASGTKAPISALQKEQIKKIYKENLGAITEYNDFLGSQMADTIKDRIAQGGSYSDIQKDIRQYVTQTFGKDGVTINRVGQTRKIVTVGRNGELIRTTKEITRPYTSTIDAYSQMLSRTSAHAALESGRAEGYKKQGVKKVRLVGGDWERSRPWHQALVGNIYEIGSDDYEMAMSILSEPFCRHRFIPFMDDPEIDVPQSVFDKRREESKVYWDEDKKQWAFPETKA